MKDTCKVCGLGLMARWCQNASCSSFVDVLNAQTAGLFDFYLDRPGVFRTAHDDAFLCKDCGRVLVLRALTNPCQACLSDPARMEAEALKDQFAISETRAYRRQFTGEEMGLDDDWQGFSIEVLGKRLGLFSQLTISEENLHLAARVMPYPVEILKANPHLLLPFSCLRVPEDPDLIVKILYLRARYRQSPMFAEKRFSPYGPLAASLRTEVNNPSDADYQHAEKALSLLGVVVSRVAKPVGRPSGLEGETISSIAMTYAWLRYMRRDRGLPMPKLEDVADEYDVHRVTLSNYIRKRLNTDWRAVERQGITIAQTLTFDQIPAFIKNRF